MNIRNQTDTSRSIAAQNIKPGDQFNKKLGKIDTAILKIYISKKKASINFVKIQSFFSGLISGQDKSRESQGRKIAHINQKIECAKEKLNGKKVDFQREQTQIEPRSHISSGTDTLTRPNIVPPQTIIFQQTVVPQAVMPLSMPVAQNQQYQQHQPTNFLTSTQQPIHAQVFVQQQVPPPVYSQMPVQQQTYIQSFGQQPMQTETFIQQPFIAPTHIYVMPSVNQNQSYFDNSWYCTSPHSTPTTQASHANSGQDTPPFRRSPPNRTQDVNPAQARQQCRMGMNPDVTSFKEQVGSNISQMFAPIKQWNTLQILHALSHVVYSGEIPTYADPKMKQQVFEMISMIEQMRLDYVPNANNRQPNHYKIIFNNLLRDALVERLPAEHCGSFVSADEKYVKSGDFNTLITDYVALIKNTTEVVTGQTRELSTNPKPGQITSQWLAQMNASLTPLREQMENLDDLERYEALYYMLGGDITESSASNTVKNWTEAVNEIRDSQIYQAEGNESNEQKIFFNNNLRSVIKNLLPEDFQNIYDTEWKKFHYPEDNQQAVSYNDFKKNTVSIVGKKIDELVNIRSSTT